MSTHLLDHEKLRVYQESLRFIIWLEALLPSIPAKTSAKDQIERASTSIPLNIAEGNGRHTSSDRCRFFDNARGSALECAAALDVLQAKGFMNIDVVNEGKIIIQGVVSMLVGLIKNNSDYRVHEELATYDAKAS